MNELLCLQSVTKAFGGLIAVDQIDMTIYEGQIFGLIGPNGAGKTTLLIAYRVSQKAPAVKLLLEETR